MMFNTCSAVKRRLQAFHDGELRIEDQVAVESHLRTCPRCARAVEELQSVGNALRTAAAARTAVGAEDLRWLATRVVSRMRAERAESLPMRFQRMFEDLHLVWAALGATGATVACLILIFGVFYFGVAHERPDSLAGVIASLSSPGQPPTPIELDGVMPPASVTLPAKLPVEVLDQDADAVLALAAMVTREGRLENVELLESGRTGTLTGAADRKAIDDLVDWMKKTTWEPARRGNSPVDANIVWLLAHTTVRGKARSQSQIPHKLPVVSAVIYDRRFA